MLKINKLVLVANSADVRILRFDKNINFIKMGNSKGKTSLFKLIDYLLGSSSVEISLETFKGIDLLKLFTNRGIFIRKTNDANYFAFKLREEDSEEVVSKDYYLSQIENACLDGQSEDSDAIKKISDENITFRTFTLFNFLDEHYLGQIEKNIFSKQMRMEYYRAKYIFGYIFNKKNILRISALKKDIASLNEKIIKTKIEQDILQGKIDNLKNIFNVLGIRYHNNIDKNITELNDYENGFFAISAKPKETQDYYYVLEVYNNLCNTIRKLKAQRETFKSRNEINDKRILLLESLKELYNDGDNNEIIDPIISIIEKCELIGTGFNYEELEETIKELDNKRKIIVKILQNAKASSEDADVSEKTRIIAEARLLLHDISKYTISSSNDDPNSIKQMQKEIRELNNKYDKTIEDKINEYLNNYYSCLKNKNYEFVNEDYEKKDFRLAFNYKKMSIYGYMTTTNDDGQKYETITMVESMSRQTAIQLCAYFAFNQLIKEDYCLPIVNTLFLDNVSKPFENSNKPIVLDLLKEFVKKVNDFNVIITTDCDEDNDGNIEYLEDGLNPLYEK